VKEKCPDSTFILGGPITWSLREEGKLFYLEFFDYVFIMDGEETLPMFMSAFEDASYTDLPQIIEAEARFPIQQAENIHIDLLKPKILISICSHRRSDLQKGSRPKNKNEVKKRLKFRPDIPARPSNVSLETKQK
jgi:hypothetical protein